MPDKHKKEGTMGTLNFMTGWFSPSFAINNYFFSVRNG